MTITEHALKRLDLLLGNHHARNEVKFMHEYLLPGRHAIHWSRGIEVNDVLLFSERCEHFGVRILGMETHLESPYSLHIYCYEDFVSQYNSNWIPKAIKLLIQENVTQNIVPTISVPTELIAEYLF